MTESNRNDHEPGFIYLIEAIGFHGLISPLKRCKIGLSRNPEARRETFIKSQFPCDVRIIKSIFVEDMLDIESKLHKQFESCNVKLEKSQEWFDLTPLQYWKVRLAFITNEVHVFSFSELPHKTIAASVGLIFVIGAILGGVGVKVASNYLPSIQANK
jgi:T5orf172 domain